MYSSQNNQVFFFGDLNYRVMLGVDTEEVFELLARNPHETILSDRNITLLAMDQLNIERTEGTDTMLMHCTSNSVARSSDITRKKCIYLLYDIFFALSGRAFENYLEGNIDFKPTYKYIAGTDSYDNRPDGKIRTPGWCDRILWKINKPPHYPGVLGASGSDDGGAVGRNSWLGIKSEGMMAGEDGIQWARRISALTESNPEKGVAEKVRPFVMLHDARSNKVK
jgi:hypothetical protein